jgi:nitrite reductase/ring-hydroxylating ferredoxin subunit
MMWNTYRSSPPPGTPLCRLDDLSVSRVVSVAPDSGLGAFPILVVATGDGPRAYMNLCPHLDLPLDLRSSDILSADGTMILCSNHQAGFRITDGVGVKDLAIDCDLEPVPLACDADGMIRIA